MTANMIIFMVAVITPALCDHNSYVYDDNCAPPPGFDNITTPIPGATTLYPYYYGLRPIERCCPACEDCKDYEGTCVLRWALDLYPHCCDFAPVEPCKDYSCKCCIRCGDDTCSQCVQTGGECRVECLYNELEDDTHECSYHNNGTGCKCCKNCEATSDCAEAEGVCVTNPNNCPLGMYPSTGCCGGCYCCKPALTPTVIGGACSVAGAYCSEVAECMDGFYACYGECISTHFDGGLSRTELGYCCIPKQQGNPSNNGMRMEPFHLDAEPFFHHDMETLAVEHARSSNNFRNRHPRQLHI